MKAHAAELATSVGLMSTPAWVAALQYTDLILSTLAALVGFLVGCHALYRILKGRPEKL